MGEKRVSDSANFRKTDNDDGAMECTIAAVFGKFALVATDQTHAHSILVVKDDETKTFPISDNIVMAVSGESGDTVQFAEFVAKNVQLYKMRNGYELCPAAAAAWTRRNLADYLRSRTPFMVNLNIVGYDKEKQECELYHMDYLAAAVKVNYAAHGYGGFFTTAILDAHYRKDMTQDEAYELFQDCVKEVQKRLILNLPNFAVQVIDKDGIRKMKDITVKNLPA